MKNNYTAHPNESGNERHEVYLVTAIGFPNGEIKQVVPPS